ncbi:hypothetical protein [Isoalcanivorax beigongshangi]|uniref:Uncharacterized protein n=1 Tax=Isoalcanivorax beigongshangi TaxID=3238810 RepID=A0ABV4AJT7_9GAMM
MTDSRHALATRLLDAQVQFVLDQLQGERFAERVREEIGQALALMDRTPLTTLVTAEQVRQTARRYAIEMPIPPAIPELIGEIAERVYNHPGHDTHRFGDVVSDQEVAEMVDVVLEMEVLHQRLLGQLAGSPITIRLISDLLYRGIRGFVDQGASVAGHIPGASSVLKLGKSVVNRAAPKLEKTAEASIKKYIAVNARSLIGQTEQRLERAIASGDVRRAVLDYWQEVKEQPLSRIKQYVTQDEIEDAMVAGLEFWKTFREARYLQAMIDAGIDWFFQKYGDGSLASLIEDMGVDSAMIEREILHYAPAILDHLREQGVLEQQVRRQLEPFWQAESTLALLG